mmetsp:Transcript_29498/g.85354  ORF Transcript_29498/g.85354 Transcript_29498/m.85354 type:complete len:419 (-) Transcript_29498:890-2146(-)
MMAASITSTGTVEVARQRPLNFVASAVQQVTPSVVRIDVVRPVFDPLAELFDFDGNNRRQMSQGSGVVFSEEGRLITNAHVVDKALSLTVTLHNGQTYPAKVTGLDELSDLAVVKIDTPKERGGAGGRRPIKFPAAKLGNSDELQVGDWVIAVGNPVGLDSTVTLGIVSSLTRSSAEVGIPDKKLSFIQTDAAVNYGNSGGPLVNEVGEVVGIATAIRPHAEGIGFAIPINKAKSILDQLSEGKTIQHAYVGIQLSTLNPELARQKNEDPNSPVVIPEVHGALVERVLPDTPASRGGLRRFDILVEVDGEKIRSAEEIVQVVDRTPVGQVLQFKLQRGDRVQTIGIKTEDLMERERKRREERERKLRDRLRRWRNNHNNNNPNNRGRGGDDESEEDDARGPMRRNRQPVPYPPPRWKS